MIETVPYAKITPINVETQGSTRIVINATVGQPVSAEGREETKAWSHLSVATFGRDWDSEEDSIYDAVQQR